MSLYMCLIIVCIAKVKWCQRNIVLLHALPKVLMLMCIKELLMILAEWLLTRLIHVKVEVVIVLVNSILSLRANAHNGLSIHNMVWRVLSLAKLMFVLFCLHVESLNNLTSLLEKLWLFLCHVEGASLLVETRCLRFSLSTSLRWPILSVKSCFCSGSSALIFSEESLLVLHLSSKIGA
jgi:hypothetical protein